MRSSGFVLLCLTLFLPLAGTAAARPVLTESGTLEGTSEGGLTVYKGVAFAAPPLAELRWQAPQPVHPWQGVRKAGKFAPACMQKGVSMPGETPPLVSEDCLYLNIWTPAKAANERLPVLVWIYGGGYSNGSASMPLYWGDRLARKGVIVITIAYRLGPLGFLAHPELSKESQHHSSGNYGLMDQIAALEWVQHNISAFGGDAKRITIAGQSAGSMSVSMLLAAPRAKGLFQRAIGESGGVFEPLQLAPNYLLVNAERDGEKYVTSLQATSIQQLRQLPASELLAGDAAVVTHPVIEPYVLPVAPYAAYVSGSENDVPLLIGSNAEEARSLVDTSKLTVANFAADIEKNFGALPPQLIAAYPHATDVQAQQARLDFERDLRFGWDMWAWARLHTANAKNPVFYYSFNRRPPFPADSVYAGWGASHFAELFYVFDHLDQAALFWSSADRKLADEISTYWVNFVKSGNPNKPGLVTWPAFNEKDRRVLYLDSPITVGGIAHSESLKTFDAVYAAVRGTPFGTR
jgi:para-nitrobenzyl esterase